MIRLATLTLLTLWQLLLSAQSVNVGTVDIYGNRTLHADSVYSTIRIQPGDTVNQQQFLQHFIEKRLQTLQGVRLSIATMICCDSNGAYHLFVGIAENDSSIIRHRPAPVLRIRLPDKYTNAYKQFTQRLSDAIIAGEADEDWSNGYSLVRYLPARKIQEKFVAWADADFTTLSKVLRESSFEDERATAAQIIAYSPDKEKLTTELVFALNDASNEVRNNAARSLAAVSYYAIQRPERKLNVPYEPFLKLLNSVVWSDRNKALSVLMQLTKSRDSLLLDRLRAVCLPSLVEMSQWSSRVHAFPAYVILCRMAGRPESEIARLSAASNFAEDAKKLAMIIQ